MMVQQTLHHRTRSGSFGSKEEAHFASGILTDILRDNHVMLGGSSIGKGLKIAAKSFLKKQEQELATMGVLDAAALVEDAFYVVDLGVIVSQVYQWRKFFPRVEPFYAVKCNPDPVVVKTLMLLGCSFDCASLQEIALVHQAASELDKEHRPEIIYANPCKARKHLAYAVQQGVTTVTFDNVQEGKRYKYVVVVILFGLFRSILIYFVSVFKQQKLNSFLQNSLQMCRH